MPEKRRYYNPICVARGCEREDTSIGDYYTKPRKDYEKLILFKGVRTNVADNAYSDKVSTVRRTRVEAQIDQHTRDC
jgi:hypothetical protein